jgi:hypothetical protein
MNYGSVLIGTSVTNQVLLRNAGGGTLSGTAGVSAPFSIVSGGTYSLSAGLSQPVKIRYNPVAAGSHSQTVTFSGANGVTAAVSGAGVISIPAPIVLAISQTGLDIDPIKPGLQIYAGSVVQYSCSASDPLGFPLSWQWIYTVDGGNETTFLGGTGNVTSANFAYQTSEAGKTYVWKLRVGNGFTVAESTLPVELIMPTTNIGNLTFQADSGVITSPLTSTNGSISQAVTTLDLSGGRAVYTFSITNAGVYLIEAIVDAPNWSRWRLPTAHGAFRPSK